MAMMFRWITSVLLSLLCISASGQSALNKETDSLQRILQTQSVPDTTYIKTLLSLGRKQRAQDPHSALPTFQEAIKRSQELGNAKLEAKALNDLAICYGMQDDYTNSILYFNRSLQRALIAGLPIAAAESYNGLGVVHKRMGDYSSSLSFYSKALTVYDSLDVNKGILSTSLNIGSLYGSLGETEKAMEFFSKTLALAEQENDVAHIAHTQANIAKALIDQNEYHEASTLLISALHFYTDHGSTDSRVITQANLGWCFYKLNNFDRARAYLIPALEEAKALKLSQHTINILESLAKLNADEGNFRESKRYASEAYNMAQSLGSFALKAKVEELMSYVHEKSGDKGLALDYFKRYKEFQDSIFNDEKARAYKSHQVTMEVAQKDRMLETQSLQLAYLDEQVTLQNRWKWTLAIASFLLLSAVVLYYQKFRQRKAYATTLEKMNDLISGQRSIIEAKNKELAEKYALRIGTDETINYFASSIIGKNNVDEILWDLAKNCIEKLGLVDCVIYLVDHERQMLVQKAAYGNKTTGENTIFNPIEIPVGKGIVGSVAKSGRPEVVSDTSVDGRYLVDDAVRLSELTVPLLYQGNVIGVIDSEHPDKNFFQQFHLDSLKTIAAIAASKIAQVQATEEAQHARLARLEAEKIKEVDQMKSHFFANISHEFRTPLNLILGPLQLYRENIPADHVDMMTRNAQRLLRLVNQLLDLAKLEVGKLQVHTKPTDINEFLRIQGASFSSLAESKQLSYSYEVPQDELVARIDSDKLEKICYNLLSNAIKFTPSGGSVFFSASMESPTLLRISVRDTGIGIPKEYHNRIFERFYQVDNRQTRNFEGSGIGLSLTKELVDLLRGTIRLNADVDTGSEFIIRLPLVLTDEPVGDAASFQINPSANEVEFPIPVHEEGKPLMLLVEDNIDLRNFITRNVSDAFNVIEAVDGEDGIAQAIEKIPDIIVTDVMMPKIDGIELTHQLKNNQLTSHIPIIMLTARDDGHTKKTGLRGGADQYVTKPFDLTELQIRIDGLVRQRHQLRKKFSGEIFLRPKDVAVTTHDGLFMESVLRLVEENISNPDFAVEDMQRELALSRMQLHRKLKALTDNSATEFIREIRLQRAAQLLKDPGRQVAEVAYQVGFNHLSYFAKCFKEKYGVAPSSFVAEKPNSSNQTP